MGFRQIFGASTAPKYSTDVVPSNIWGVYSPQIFDGWGSVKYLGGLHLRVRVEAHQMQLRARHAKEWDARHAEHGMSQSSVAQSVEKDRLRSVALAASGKEALCVLMQATPMQMDSGPKTLQMFVAAH